MSAITARGDRTRTSGVTSSLVVIAGLACFALALRIAWTLWHGPAEITWDGAEYARIAANLLSGHGYVGLRGTTMFVFPPLYPLAIAALLPLTHDAAQAAVDVSLLSGAAFVFPVYGIAEWCYGRRAGYAAAVIAAVLPFTVQLSTVALADMLFLSLAAAGIYYLLRVAAEPRLLDAAACGSAFALAYLTRPEGLLLWILALAVAICAVFRPARRRQAAATLLAIAIPFAVIALPYAAVLSAQAKSVRVEGKSILNLDIGLRMERGMTYTVAADGIDRDLNQVGPELRQDYYFNPPGRTSPALRTTLQFGAQNLIRHVREIAHVLWSPLCGTAILALLALLGLVAGTWTRRRAADTAILLAYGCVIVVSLASVYHFWDRYFVGFVPLLIVWGAHGVDVLSRFAAARAGRRWTAAVPLALTAVLLFGLLFSSKVRFVDDSQTLAERDAGRWLAQNGGAGARILSISDQAVFYAGGTWFMLPYAPDAQTALRYLRKERPDYVVLDEEYAAERPYVGAWLATGIPDPRARVVYARTAGDPAIAVVRWGDAGRR